MANIIVKGSSLLSVDLTSNETGASPIQISWKGFQLELRAFLICCLQSQPRSQQSKANVLNENFRLCIYH